MSSTAELDMHGTREYKRGIRKLAEWHETCRRKRLGIKEAQEKLSAKLREARRERELAYYRRRNAKRKAEKAIAECEALSTTNNPNKENN